MRSATGPLLHGVYYYRWVGFEFFGKLAPEMYFLIDMDFRLSVGGRYASDLAVYEGKG
jgi:hypothetical protein